MTNRTADTKREGSGEMAASAERASVGTTSLQQIERGLESKGRLLVADQAVAMGAFVADNAFVNVRQLIQQTLAGDQDLLYGTFADGSGHTWAYGDRHSPT